MVQVGLSARDHEIIIKKRRKEMKLKQLRGGENAFQRNAVVMLYFLGGRREIRSLCVRALFCACLRVTLGGQRLHQTGDTHTHAGGT